MTNAQELVALLKKLGLPVTYVVSDFNESVRLTEMYNSDPWCMPRFEFANDVLIKFEHPEGGSVKPKGLAK